MMKTLHMANAEFLPVLCEYIAQGHSTTLRARGNSMRPFVENDRDEAILVSAKSYRVGDVVLAEISKGHYVLHRIDRITLNGKPLNTECSAPEAEIVLRGDGNVRGTEHCRMADVRGLCSHFVRNGKKWDLRTSRLWKIYSWYWTHTLFARRYQLALYRLLFLGELPRRLRPQCCR